MTTYTSEPGTRLGGRYRLEDRIAAGSGWAAWKAIDETLARAVTVFTFAPGFPRVSDVVKAARAASRLTDPRVAQVFDVEDAWDRAYVVMEWAAGETLGDMLSHGPLEPARSARMIAEAAAAIAAAHAAGVAHTCLSPGSVRWTQTGEVKVVGLGINAALSGISSDDPVTTDTIGLGKLLYAALTAHWPGPDQSELPPAPMTDGHPFSPRQVMAGVPALLSDLTCRALQMPIRGGAPITEPAELARELTAAIPLGPVPRRRASEQAHADHQRRATWLDETQTGGWHQAAVHPAAGHPAADPEALVPYDAESATSGGQGADRWQDEHGWVTGQGNMAESEWPSDLQLPDQEEFGDVPGPPPRRVHVRGAGARRPGPATLRGRIGVMVAAGGAVAVAATLLAALLSGGKAPGRGHPSTSGSGGPTGTATSLKPTGASGFDALNSSDRGNEQSRYAYLAIDGNPSTSWQTQWYKTDLFGGLKTGTGLIIDMGKQVRISSVTVDFGPIPGTDVQLRVGNSNARTAANVNGMAIIAQGTGLVGSTTFTIKSPVTSRYLVIWFTKLPPKPGPGGWYMGQVFEVTVRGTA